MTGRTDDDPRDLIFEEGDDEDRKEYGISDIIFEEEYDDDTKELLHEQSIIGMAAGGYDCYDYLDDDWIIREQRCLLQNINIQSCKTKTDNVACPKRTKLHH